MRQYSPATARQAPTDRNPTKVQNGSTGNAIAGAVQITTFLHARRTGPAAAAGTTIQLGAFTYFLKAGDRIIVSASENAGAGTSEAGGGIEGVEYDA